VEEVVLDPGTPVPAKAGSRGDGLITSHKLVKGFPRRFVMNFVVIGGDAAGMSAASRAKRNKPDLQVTVLEQTKDVSYSA
jgi:hypothetical protein